MYGAAPDKAKAEKFLTDAGVDTPVTIKLQYNPDHYGSNSDQEYNAVKRQLEESGLFKVDLQSTEWTTYQEESKADAYPAFQLGWFPDFPDADNYLSPFLSEGEGNFTNNHYNDPKENLEDPGDDEAARRAADSSPTRQCVSEDSVRSSSVSLSRCPTCRCSPASGGDRSRRCHRRRQDARRVVQVPVHLAVEEVIGTRSE